MTDYDWLQKECKTHNKNLSKDKVDAFLERVAIMICDGMVEEEKARRLAFLKVITN